MPSSEPTLPAEVRLGPADAGRCRRRVHLDHDLLADRSRQRPPDAGLLLRRDTLAAHRRDVRDLLVDSGLPLRFDWDPAGGERPSVAWSTRLAAPHRFARPELLLRDASGGYLPVLVRGHRTTDPGSGARITPLAALAGQLSHVPPGPSTDPAAPALPPTNPAMTAQPLTCDISSRRKLRSHHADLLALAHVRLLLDELGLAAQSTLGGIIGFGGPSSDPDWDDGAVVVWHDLAAPHGTGPSPLDDYRERFADRLAVATAAVTGAPPLAQPARVAECRRCPWWTVCGPELEAAHDVSLLASGNDGEILRAAGASTYDEVAAMDPALLATLPLTGIPAREAVTRARALAAGVPMVRRSPRLDVVRADVELDVDMESYLDDGAYLWGTLLTGAPVDGFQPGYRPFATWQPLDSVATGANFVAFWRYVEKLRGACAAAGLTFAAYCYSHKAEERWLYGTPARYPDAPGMPTREEIAAFCGSAEWVDLYTEIKRLFIVPGSLRLKAVAPIAGFTWRDAEAGGENSMAWYRAAVMPPDGSAHADPSAAEASRRRILQYNEDDVLATFHLRQWMSDHPDAMPTVDSLAADPG